LNGVYLVVLAFLCLIAFLVVWLWGDYSLPAFEPPVQECIFCGGRYGKMRTFHGYYICEECWNGLTQRFLEEDILKDLKNFEDEI